MSGSRAANIRLTMDTRPAAVGLTDARQEAKRFEQQLDQANQSVNRMEREVEQLRQELLTLSRANKQLSADMRKLTADTERTERATRKLDRTAGQTANTLRRAGRSGRATGRLFGQASAATSGLAGSMGALIPQAGTGAMVLGEAASAAEMFAGAGAAVLRVLGPIAIAVLAAGAAWAYFNHQVKEAEERQERAAELAAAASARAKTRDDFAQDLSDRALIASGQASAEDVQLVRRTDEIREDLYGEEIRRLQGELAASGAKFGTEYDRINDQIEQMQQNAADLAEEELRVTQEEEKQVALVQEQVRLEQERARVISERRQEQERARLEEERRMRMAADAERIKRELSASNPGLTSAEIDQMAREAAERQNAARHSPGVGLDRVVDYRTGLQGAGGIGQQIAGLPGAFSPERLASSVTSFANPAGFGLSGANLPAAQALVGGNLAGLAGAAGPYGALAAGGISALQTLGDKGSQGVIDELRAQTDALVAGLYELPDLLPDLVEEAPAIAEASADALLAVAPELARAFAAEFNPLNKGLKSLEGMTGALGLDGISGKIGSVRGNLKNLILGRNHSGLALNDREVPTILEAGEVVTRRGDLESQSARMTRNSRSQGGGGGTVINYNGPVYPDGLQDFNARQDTRYGPDIGWESKPRYAGGPQ